MLDINRVMRPVARALRRRILPHDFEATVSPTRLWWTRHGEDTPWAEVEVSLTLHWDHAIATLRFNVDHWSEPTGLQIQRVQVVSTPCRFGGQRWWWLCPRTGRRSGKLYLPNGGTLFLSRGGAAYPLAYASQNGSAIDRSHARLARLYRKMGTEYCYSDDLPPPKPKRMRRLTYERLVQEWEEASNRHEGIFVAGEARLLARIEKRQE